ncbi:MAG: endonuclease/exonuclease/phosphatase family protein [Methanoregula sp.]
MKIITWNVAHQAKTNNTNLFQMAEVLTALSPDIIVLTEYCPGDLHKKFTSSLRSLGFGVKTSECPPTEKTQNHVLIASRMSMEETDSGVPLDSYHAIPCNALQVTIPEHSLGILGLRLPVSMTAAQMKTWWDWVTAVAERNQNHPFIILGDFNTDLSSEGPNGGRRLIKLKEDGWYHALPKEGASYWSRRGGVISPFRIDHAFCSRNINVLSSEYLTEYGQFLFAKIPDTHSEETKKIKAMSDHAILVVEFDLK